MTNKSVPPPPTRDDDKAPHAISPLQARAGTAAVASAREASEFATIFNEIVDNVGGAVLGKTQVVRLALTTLFAEGHLLLEDAPGTGKTILAKSIAASIHGTHNRIQFTPDLLPSDVTGVTIFDQKSGEFEFHKGPVFASVVLADEINRASPKTQSALLEVMEESRVTVDGKTYDAGRPFLVMATQNPIEQTGTYKLPEAQLDRFLIKTSLGYPDRDSVIEILAGSAQRDRTTNVKPIVTSQEIISLAGVASRIYIDPAIADYVARLAEETRNDPQTRVGVSVRGSIALVRCAKVWAAAQGRNYVIPDDVKALAMPVLAHRLVIELEAEFDGVTSTDIMSRVLSAVAPPSAKK
ncbi:AAA family ATPase [Timonella sp. A28]|uniref:AAA family ATPase n=1 Tax=Timonella sp. A28 TaxID=3442640 RepID=UPI003EBD929A